MSCTCPDFGRRTPEACKHIIHVLRRIFKLTARDHLVHGDMSENTVSQRDVEWLWKREDMAEAGLPVEPSHINNCLKEEDGDWIFGIWSPIETRIFFVQNRKARTLSSLILRNVEVGSIVSDCWRGYAPLSRYGYDHHQMNHSKEFVSREGFHTNSIEREWVEVRRVVWDLNLQRGSQTLAALPGWIWFKSVLRHSVCNDAPLLLLQILGTEQRRRLASI